MKTAKITEVKWFNERNWPHWLLYFITIKLDNWEEIQLGKKKSDAFKVGDTVSYEDTIWDDGKKRWKQIVENTRKPKHNAESANKWAMIWMAMNLAFNNLYDRKEDNFNECIALATRIYEEAMELYNSGAEQKPEQESEKDVDLPF